MVTVAGNGDLTSEEDEEALWTESVMDAVRAFARTRFRALARSLISRLQRVPASGIYGDDYRHKTLWDEYCHEAQEGPHTMLDEAWGLTLRPYVQETLNTIAPEEGPLLSIASERLDDQPEKFVAVDPDLLEEQLLDELGEYAVKRDMSRFDPLAF